MSSNRFKDFIQLAIDNEVAAAALYEKYASVVSAASAKKLLASMALMERGHEKKLREFLKTGTAWFSKIGVIEDIQISDYMSGPELTSGSTIQDVFVFAMKAEDMAFDLYSKLGSIETDSVTKNLFSALAGEEKKHKHDLEVEYEKNFMPEN
jgi:rubrerythrin